MLPSVMGGMAAGFISVSAFATGLRPDPKTAKKACRRGRLCMPSRGRPIKIPLRNLESRLARQKIGLENNPILTGKR
jgi:hypothetical protein